MLVLTGHDTSDNWVAMNPEGAKNTIVGPKPEHLLDIDVSKGVAIALVVLGHVVARDIKPQGNAWFTVFVHHLYVFHMSFFFYLAGYVFWTAPIERYVYRVRQAAVRMLPAYLLMAVIAFAAKRLLSPFVPVDRPGKSFWSDWLTFFAYPTEGFITYLWFIVALLGIYAMTLAAHKLLRGKIHIIIALALVLHLLSVNGHVTKLFALQQMTRYWLIFVVAYYAFTYRNFLTPWFARTWPALMILLIVSLIWLPPTWQLTLSALISIPALHGMAASIAMRAPSIASRLARLGSASWPIYLFNGFAMGAVKVVILKSFGWDGAYFLIALPILLLSGLILPVYFQRKLLTRVAWLNRITR